MIDSGSRFGVRGAARLSLNASTGAIAASLLFVATSQAAFAQVGTDPSLTPNVETASKKVAEENPNDIIVSGLRSAIQASITEKRLSNQIVESISSEDIGKLPDNSIADSIARLPGVTAQRVDGRSQAVSIRGFGPDFSTTLLNGREQTTVGDNRGVEYDQFPSELISQVVIYKTPSAALVGAGMSGTVDLRTIRPLEYGKQAIAVNARGEWLSLGALNSGSKDTGYRLSGLYVDQFMDDTLGIAVGIAHMESPTQIERFNAWGYPNYDATNIVIGGAKPYVTSTELKRTGVVGTLEYTPNDNFTTVGDVYWSKFDDSQILRGIEFPLQWSSASLAPGYTAAGGRITSGTFNGVKGVVRNDANARDATNLALGWNAKFQKDGWMAFTDVSYSHVTRNDTILESYSGTGPAGSGPYDNLGFTTNSNSTTSFNPSINYADANLIKLTSPQGWGSDVIPGGQVGYVNYPTVDDELFAWRTGFERELDMGFLKSVSFGFNYADRTKSLVQDEYFLGLKNGALSQPIPAGSLLAPTELGFLGVPGMVSYDPIALVNGGTYNLVRNPNADVLTKGWDVSEQVMTGYLQLNIDTPVGNNTLTGNVGVQVINTNQRSNGEAASGTPAFTSNNVSGGAEYTYALPSLNLSLRTPEQFVARFGLSKQMARARLDQMRASINFSYNPALANQTDPEFSPWGGSGGNPALRPWIANAVDVSFEKYFGPVAYVAVAGFYKNLDTYIYDQSVLYNFTGFPVSSGPAPVLNVGYVTIPTNGNGGEMYGVEFSGTLPFNKFTDALEGFGLIGNFSITESNIQPDPNNASSPIPGLSKYVGNATLYFEKQGFQARVSLSYRSEFLGEVAGFGNARTFRTVDPETLVDAQIGYEFQPGSKFAGLSILLQGQNLSNEPFVTYQSGDTTQVIDNQNFGRRFLFGIGYKFGMNK